MIWKIHGKTEQKSWKSNIFFCFGKKPKFKNVSESVWNVRKLKKSNHSNSHYHDNHNKTQTSIRILWAHCTITHTKTGEILLLNDDVSFFVDVSFFFFVVNILFTANTHITQPCGRQNERKQINLKKRKAWIFHFDWHKHNLHVFY